MYWVLFKLQILHKISNNKKNKLNRLAFLQGVFMLQGNVSMAGFDIFYMPTRIRARIIIIIAQAKFSQNSVKAGKTTHECREINVSKTLKKQ